MFQFRKMLDTVTSKGILSTHKVTGNTMYRLGPRELKYLQFLDSLDKCQHFVFTAKHGSPIDATTLPKAEQLDLPFKAISIETLGKPITVSRANAEVEVSTQCLYIIERAPKDYLVFAYVESPMGNEVFLVKDKDDDSCGEGSFMAMIQSYLDRLALEKEGIQSVRERVKVGQGNAKRVHTIRRIIYVTPKKEVEAFAKTFSKPLDWSQRWLVRGHWRKNDSIGKDREGNYCIEGFTWVTEHVKGPEHAPLISKTRLVKS